MNAHKAKLLAREIASIGRIAGPLVVGQLSQVGMGFTDTVMAGHLGAVDLAAVALGSTLWVPIYLACAGVMMALSPSVAHHQGAGRQQAIAILYRQSLWLSAALALLAVFVIAYVGAFMHWVGVDRIVIPITEDYLDAIIWGMPAACFYMGLRFVSEGIGYTRPVMYVQLLGLLANALGNYVFMYGALGNPAMGAVGAGWSSALVLTLMTLAMLIIVLTQPRYRPYRLFSQLEGPNATELRQLLRLGLPIATVTLLEIGLFTAVGLLMGSLGAAAIAAHQIALNYAALMFMIPLGISMATTVRVGQAMGANNHRGARIAGFSGMGMATGVMLFSAVIMLSVPEVIVGIYTTDQEVAKLAKSLLLIAAMFQLSDGLQAGALGALRGLKDTRFPVLITLVAYWAAGLPLAWYLGFELSIGPRGLWIGLVLGLSVAAVLLSARFYRLSHPCHSRKAP